MVCVHIKLRQFKVCWNGGTRTGLGFFVVVGFGFFVVGLEGVLGDEGFEDDEGSAVVVILVEGGLTAFDTESIVVALVLAPLSNFCHVQFCRTDPELKKVA
jgi:hypothetical protein